MKKLWIAVLLCGILCLAGCGGQEKSAKEPRELTTTVMIYMVGSDLETKSGAGTSDLEEIAASGVDLSKTNVLVYAGGSPKWHNELADPEKHTLLQMKEGGFAQVTQLQAFSMGDSQCLSNFLKYGYSNYPAQQYALILWDHGNGPVMGYGKDMLFDNDSLTLQEMATALEDSPFGPENKLKWVGFDACLMASAELACIWAPYADYLVASQEVEPAFGWNYDFMSTVCSSDTRQVLTDLAQGYLDACLAYFDERGYEDRDTTLSCMDLSYAAELESAINALFARASADVPTQYDQLTARRAKTRALGRASTGSEYDLIDLRDMGMWLGQLYPEEVTALQQVLEKMTVTNLTNSENLCGMSLYYPFYNKRYYEKDWAQAYKELGLLPEYQVYLEGYEKIWLQNDKLTLASSVMPNMVSRQTYTLQLTPEQAESYASSRYYILERLGDELYTIVYASSNVTQENGLLTANFNGNVIYLKDGIGQYVIPVTQEHDTVGDVTRYSVYTYLDNELSVSVTAPEGYEEREGSFRYQLAVNNVTQQIGISALLPADQEVASQGMLGGKTEEVDLSQWVSAMFPNQRHRYLVRHENGTVKRMSQWPVSGIMTGFKLYLADGMEFVYAPLTAGDYCIVFEVEDTQGNRYCSELLPITADGQLPEAKEPETVQRHWQGDAKRVVLWEQDGMTLFMQKAEDAYGATYTLGMDNQTERSLLVFMENPFINDSVDATRLENLITFEALPGQVTVQEDGIDSWGALADMQVIDEIRSMKFQILVRDALTMKTVLARTWVDLRIDEPNRLTQLKNWFGIYWENMRPSRGAFATEQVLCENEYFRLSLLTLGDYRAYSEEQDIYAGFKIENISEYMLYPSIQGLVLDGVFLQSTGGPDWVHPGCTAYFTTHIGHDDLQRANLTDIRDVKVVMRFDQNYTILGLGGFAQIQQFPVKLSQSGAGSKVPTGDQVIFEENGVRIRMLLYSADEWANDWYVVVENNSDLDICLAPTNCVINGQEVSDTSFDNIAIYDGQVPAHQKAIARISLIHFGALELEEMSLDLLLQDFTQQKVLYAGSTRIELKVADES